MDRGWLRKGKLSDFWDFIGRKVGDRATQLQTCTTLEEKMNDSEGRSTDTETEAREAAAITTGPEDKASSYRGLFSGLELHRNLSFWDSDLLENGDLFIPLNSSILEWECLFDVCPIIVFWKQTTCFLVLQAHRWRGILSPNGSYPGSRLYLI